MARMIDQVENGTTAVSKGKKNHMVLKKTFFTFIRRDFKIAKSKTAENTSLKKTPILMAL